MAGKQRAQDRRTVVSRRREEPREARPARHLLGDRTGEPVRVEGHDA
jgi:hypothetical protein